MSTVEYKCESLNIKISTVEYKYANPEYKCESLNIKRSTVEHKYESLNINVNLE